MPVGPLTVPLAAVWQLQLFSWLVALFFPRGLTGMKVDVAQVISEGVTMVGTIATYEGHAALSHFWKTVIPTQSPWKVWGEETGSAQTHQGYSAN